MAGFPDSAGAPQGVAGLARGTYPVNGSHVPAPPGCGAPPPGEPGTEIDTVFSGRVVESEEGHIRTLIQRRLAELGYSDREHPSGRYLPSLAISAVPSDGLALASVKPVTRDLLPTSKDIFSKAYVNCEFHGRPLACMLDTGCDHSVIGRRFVKPRDLQPVRFSLMGAGRNSLKVYGETSIQFSIDGHPMEAEVSVSPSINELLLGCDWLTKHKGRWDFATGVVQLGNIEVQTRPKRVPEIACRRLVVAERFTVPARHEANIPVRMETDGEPQPTVEWAVESRAMKSGVWVVRTLLGDENMVRVARILNQTNSPFRLEEGDYFATAEPVITYRGPAVRSSVPSDQAEREWEWRPGRIQQHLTQASVRRGKPRRQRRRQQSRTVPMCSV